MWVSFPGMIRNRKISFHTGRRTLPFMEACQKAGAPKALTNWTILLHQVDLFYNALQRCFQLIKQPPCFFRRADIDVEDGTVLLKRNEGRLGGINVKT